MITYRFQLSNIYEGFYNRWSVPKENCSYFWLLAKISQSDYEGPPLQVEDYNRLITEIGERDFRIEMGNWTLVCWMVK